MDAVGKTFRTYVRTQEIAGVELAQADADNFTLSTADALARVSFWSFSDGPEIVELAIEDRDREGDPTFFLHFELMDEARAEELFQEMVTELLKSDLYDPYRVLLCCTAGMTTGMLAERLTEAAQTLSLDYVFCALPLEEAIAADAAWDAVLLAPQVGYRRREVQRAFPDAACVEVPARLFASLDAGGVLKLVMHVLSDHTVFPESDGHSLRDVRGIVNDKRVMIIIMIHRRRSSWTGWRIYDRGRVVDYGHIVRPRLDLRDVEDLVATISVEGVDVCDLDAIGIAVPGVVDRGIAASGFGEGDYELGRRLEERYGTRVFVDNNANAAAVGCYVSQQDYDSVVLHTQQTGHVVGGHGIVVDGHLVKGRGNFAGELAPLASAALGDVDAEALRELAWSPEGMRSLVVPMLCADMSLVAPDAIYVAVDLLDDMDVLREDLARHLHGFSDHFLPDLVRVTDYRGLIALGELVLVLQKLNQPRASRRR